MGAGTIMRVSLIKQRHCKRHDRKYRNVCYYCAMDWLAGNGTDYRP